MKNLENKVGVLSIALFVAIISSTNLFGQKSLRDIPALDSLTIASTVSYFTIKDNSFDGNGAAVLKDAVTSSKFLVLGENHNSKQISILTKNLVPLLDQSGYKVASFEVGPHSANKLKELSNNPVQTLESLKAFNKEYFIPSMEMSAIPMFFYVDDANFLAEFADTKMDFWGIDQEFFFSVVFLGDEMVASKSNDANYKEIKAAWGKARASIEAEFENIDHNNSNSMLTTIYEHEDFKNFEKMFDVDDHYAQDVLKKLYDSWYIYEKSNNSHEDRVNYIRSNFLNKYEAFEKENKDARYFIKIGSKHAATTSISFDCYDIGALTHEIAEIEQVKSTNIIISRATYEGKDFKDRAQTFLDFHQTDKWTVIDLRKLREDLNANKFQIITHPDYQDLNRMIKGFDLLIFPPADEEPEFNR